MTSNKHIFTSLIQCTNCNSNYRFSKERKQYKYVCNGYSRNTKSCTRYAVKESDLLLMVKMFCNRNNLDLEETNQFMKSIIKRIYINPAEKNIKIVYMNGEESEISNNKICI